MKKQIKISLLKQMKRLSLCLFFLFTACNLKNQNVSFYKKKFDKNKYTSQALILAKKIIFLLEKNPNKDFLKIPYLLYLSKYEKNIENKIFYQETLAKIYFKNPSQISKAIQIYFSLAKEDINREKHNQYKFFIALGYFKIKKFNQALLELKYIKQFKKKMQLSIFLLKINIFLELKLWKKAVFFYKKIKNLFYLQYKKQELALGLISAYEHLSLHHLAIKELNELETYYGFPKIIKKRISIIKKRIKNQPKSKR